MVQDKFEKHHVGSHFVCCVILSRESDRIGGNIRNLLRDTIRLGHFLYYTVVITVYISTYHTAVIVYGLLSLDL